MEQEELDHILEEHRKWIESNEIEGKKANLSGTDLSRLNLKNANLSKAHLSHANLSGANLTGANLQSANLTAVNFQDAELAQVNFEELNASSGSQPDQKPLPTYLSRATIRNSNLSDAKLSSVCGLLTESLAGANLSNAKLPVDIARFEGLTHVADTSTNAATIFFGLLGACLYSWLTIATTPHAALIANSANSTLPIINTPIPTAGFYVVAPLILLAVYIYFHLYLERLWVGLATLPAIFPDGKALDEKAYPWLLNGLVRAHLKLLRNRQRPLTCMEYFVTVILAWWLVPLTLFFFWLGYIPRHNWLVTGIHVSLMVSAIWFGVFSYQSAVRTLRGEAAKTGRLPIRTRLWRKVATFRPGKWTLWGLFLTIVPVAMAGISVSIAYQPGSDSPSDRSVLARHLYMWLGYSTYLDIRGSDISTKPANWTEDSKNAKLEFAQVKGANLQNQDLRNMVAEGAFFVKAHLYGADLRGAKLALANLRQAVFWKQPDSRKREPNHENLESAGEIKYAKLGGADLWRANLQEADLRNADLAGAILVQTRLWGADLEKSNLERANLGGAELKPVTTEWEVRPAILKGVNLRDANLRDANLEGANLEPAELAEGKFQPTDLERADLENAKLRKAILQKANLRGANFRNAYLMDANLKGARLDPAGIRGDKLWPTELGGANLWGADLEEANFKGASLRDAHLGEANLKGAILDGANLEGANLKEAKNLIQDQLNEACGSETTKLPLRLTIQPCAKEPEPIDDNVTAIP